MLATIKNTKYQKMGFYLIPQLYERNALLELKEYILKAHKSDLNTISGVKVWSSKNLPQAFKDTLFHTELISHIKKCLETNQIEFLSCKVVYKSKDITQGTPWHQDRPYWGGTDKLSVWIALDDANCENGCLRIIPGSHLAELTHSIGEKNNFSNRLQTNYSNEKIQDIPMYSGDALLFSDLLVHSSYQNVTGSERFSIIPTFRRADGKDTSNLNTELWSDPIVL